jgi:malonyl-CoA decarboxylase
VLEKLIEHEAVHQIVGWDDLRRRLADDRRCFAFFHPALPDEPLIFIEVAFTRGIAGDIQPLLDVASAVGDPGEANCAIFYSITNCQVGLRGISFGNFLIKQVVEELQREHPQLKTFSTLSPLPGFRRWLGAAREQLARRPGGAAQVELLGRLDAAGWDQAPPRSLRELQALVLQMAAHYLVAAKRGAEPLDAVARFHLGNGACLERLNWLGDRSPHGMASSAGVMANYVYRLADIERNHERYAKEHAVTAAKAVEKLASASPLAEPRLQGAR